MSSLNLSEFIVNPYTPNAYFNTEDFLHAIDVGIRTLDKLIDENYNRHPLQQQRDMSYNYRNIGLGIFGYATALMKLGMKYGSDKAIEFTDDVFSLLFKRAVFASNNLAKELGPYPKYKECIFDSDIIKKHFTPDEIDGLKKYGLRNCSLISIAPNGTLATLLGESGGCEPEFALKYTRRTVGMTDGQDTYYDVYCKAAQEYMDKNKTNVLPDYFVGSADISWKNRVLTQAAMQQHVDTAISSTVNMPNSATKDDVAQMYLLAWKTGCKGITMFRDGCKRLGILTTTNNSDDTKNTQDISTELPRGTIMSVNDDLIGYKRKITSGCGKFHLELFFDEADGRAYETFINMGKGGGCERNLEFISKLISLALRGGVPIESIIETAKSVRPCHSFCDRKKDHGDTSKGTSCPSAIGWAIEDLQKKINNMYSFDDDDDEFSKATSPKVTHKPNNEGNKCPECGGDLRYEGGCVLCSNCGWSKCN